LVALALLRARHFGRIHSKRETPLFTNESILAHGFARVRCPDCGYDTVVAFSCKERGLCPSCSARHMSETAAFLVDRVLPRVPVRQWVFAFPRHVRYILAKDAKLLGEALRIFIGEIFRDLRRRAGIRRMREGSCGAVTALQRFGGIINLNIHIHSLVLDGVYLDDPKSGAVCFRRLPPPSPDDLDRVLKRTRRRIGMLILKRRLPDGARHADGSDMDEANVAPTAMEALQGASIQGLLALSPGARKVLMSGELFDPPDEPVEFPERPFSRNSGDGYNLDAGRRIRAGDREGLETLCRYVLRPPFSQERIKRLPDGRVC
jgi:ribosomal protein S27E